MKINCDKRKIIATSLESNFAESRLNFDWSKPRAAGVDISVAESRVGYRQRAPVCRLLILKLRVVMITDILTRHVRLALLLLMMMLLLLPQTLSNSSHVLHVVHASIGFDIRRFNVLPTAIVGPQCCQTPDEMCARHFWYICVSGDLSISSHAANLLLLPHYAGTT